MVLADLMTYAQNCAPLVTPSTMVALVKAESHGNQFAISINGGYRLKHQPHNLKEAVDWINYLDTHGYNFDVGLAQINIRNIRKYGYKAIDMLDPCKNLAVAGSILYTSYHKVSIHSDNKQTALLNALSAYNTGNYYAGYKNGYVSRVVSNAEGYNGISSIKSNVDKKSSVNHSRSLVYAKTQY